MKDDDKNFKSPWDKKSKKEKPVLPKQTQRQPLKPEDDPHYYWEGELTSQHMGFWKQAGIWGVICVIAIICAGIWNEMGRGEYDALTRGTEITDENGRRAITYRATELGHFIIAAQINGVSIDFLLDTGATEIAFSKKDAQLIGFNMKSLKYNMPILTANGTSHSARVKIDTIEFGPIYMKSLNAHVVGGQMEGSLLGMNFLKRLSGYEVRSGILTLYP